MNDVSDLWGLNVGQKEDLVTGAGDDSGCRDGRWRQQ